MILCDVCPYPSKCTPRVKCVLGKINVEEMEIELPKPVPFEATKIAKKTKVAKKTKKKAKIK